MKGQNQSTTVGQFSKTATRSAALPAALTRLVWLGWLLSLGVLATHLLTGATWHPTNAVAVDGLTLVMWPAITFFSGVVHSYSRRYMAGDRDVGRFFLRLFAFTIAVSVLVAADNVALFAAAWLAMGLVMASLIGHVRGWPQARAASRVARRYFLGSSALVAVALGVLWWGTGETTASGIATAVDALPWSTWAVAAGALLAAAAIQCALVPFHRWLLSSMTAPTPASALMHAGFVNAGGILLVRFAPVVTRDPAFMLLVAVVGATSALLGKLMKTVQTDVKGKLGCSTVGQMGFMILQAGLGFFAAAITHLVLHGFYKAYQFLASGSRVERTAPTETEAAAETSLADWVATGLTALAGGAVFALLTGEGTSLDGGVVLTLLVVVTTLHAARTAVRQTSLPATVRYGAVPLVYLPAIAVYAGVYRGVSAVMATLPAVPAPAELTVVHGVVAGAFVLAYVAVETGTYRYSERLYVALLNATRPPASTLLTSRGEYDEY
ncbi:MAG: proton-conducting transporter membrane subunit [Haloplanus sp.]